MYCFIFSQSADRFSFFKNFLNSIFQKSEVLILIKSNLSTFSSMICLLRKFCSGMGWEVEERFKREGTFVYIWLIHFDVWQKPIQYFNTIILPLKISIFF